MESGAADLADHFHDHYLALHAQLEQITGLADTIPILGGTWEGTNTSVLGGFLDNLMPGIGNLGDGGDLFGDGGDSGELSAVVGVFNGAAGDSGAGGEGT